MTKHLATRIMATDSALSLLASLREKHGPLMLFQPGGSDGDNALLCYAFGDERFTNMETYLGNINGTPFYLEQIHFEYWKRNQLIIDAVSGNGATDSLESGSGMSFLTRTRTLSDEECSWLEEAEIANSHHGRSKD